MQLLKKKSSTLLVLLVLFSFACVFQLGCEKENGTGPSEGGTTELLAVAGLETLTFYNVRTLNQFGNIYGVGNAANDLIGTGANLFVLNSLSNDLLEYSVHERDIHLERQIDLGLRENRNPWSGVLHEGQLKMFITNHLQNSVSVLDLNTGIIDTIWNTGVSPEGIIFSKDIVYVACSGFDYNDLSFHEGEVWAYDAETGALLDNFSVGINPQYLAVTFEGYLHVVCTGDYAENKGKVLVLNNQLPLQVLHTIPIDGYPGRIAIDDGRDIAYLAGCGWASDGDTQGTVFRYNISTYELLAPYKTGLGVSDIEYNYAISDLVFVACGDANRIDVFSADTLMGSIPLQDSPQVLSSVWLETWD
ncbi:YncE family protein [bacterium]|nr:YncE family protein [bacterium]